MQELAALAALTLSAIFLGLKLASQLNPGRRWSILIASEVTSSRTAPALQDRVLREELPVFLGFVVITGIARIEIYIGTGSVSAHTGR